MSSLLTPVLCTPAHLRPRASREGFTKPHLPRVVSAFDSFFFFAIKIGDEMRDDAITVIVRFVLCPTLQPAGKFAPGNKGEREGERDDVRRKREGGRSKRERRLAARQQ